MITSLVLTTLLFQPSWADIERQLLNCPDQQAMGSEFLSAYKNASSFNLALRGSGTDVQTYAIGVLLPPHCSLVLVSVPMGTVTYPICSKWGDKGWLGDGSYLGVGWGYLDFVVKIYHNSGGKLP